MNSLIYSKKLKCINNITSTQNIFNKIYGLDARINNY